MLFLCIATRWKEYNLFYSMFPMVPGLISFFLRLQWMGEGFNPTITYRLIRLT